MRRQRDSWEGIGMTLVRLGPDDATCARFGRENAAAGFAFLQRNTANGHFEIVLDLFFHFAGAVPVAEGEAAMNLRSR
jgi:hypothetical protein